MSNRFSFKVLPPETQEKVQHVSVSPIPDWDDFKEFAQEFIEAEGAEIKATDYGMDRHQIDYEKEGKRFHLHYEHYSQSVWIEPID